MLKRLSCAAFVAAAVLLCLPARATVPTTASSVSYTGNGSTTAFATTFTFQKSADLVVTVSGVTKVLGTDYTVTGAGNATGLVTFTTAPASSAAVAIVRRVDLTQLTSLRGQRNYDPGTIEGAIDKVVMAQQQQTVATVSGDLTGSLPAPTLAPSGVAAGTYGTSTNVPVLTVDLKGRVTSATLTPVSVSGTTTNFTPPIVGGVTRTSPGKLADFVDASDAGALCDGSTNDSVALQAAIAGGLLTHRPVWIPSNCVGSYTNTTGVRVFDLRVLNMNGAGAFTGFAGSRTAGGPRLFYGLATDIGDDAAVIVARALVGDSLFSHAYEDQSTMTFTTTGAYASYDAIPVMNGTIHYNHLYGFQARPNYSGSGLIDEISGFSSQVLVASGSVTNVYGVHVVAPSGSGTVTNNKYGLFVDAFSGAGFGVFVAGNSSFLGGNLQIGGTLTGATSGIFSGEVTVQDFNSIGTIGTFNAGGGIAVAGVPGTTPSQIKCYSDASGAEKPCQMQPAGGLVQMGGDIQLDVNGTGRTFSTLGASPNFTIVGCRDCTIANPCASGGTGAIAKRLNSVWVCN